MCECAHAREYEKRRYSEYDSFIVEIFAKVKRCCFYIKPSSEYLIRDAISSELDLVLFLKMKQN